MFFRKVYSVKQYIYIYITHYLKFPSDDRNCPTGYIGPICKFSCNNTLDSKEDCKNVVICNHHDCTCAPGYKGVACDACEYFAILQCQLVCCILFVFGQYLYLFSELRFQFVTLIITVMPV